MGTIECPVCTLYLRADMSLEDHLETHPKEKVIQALVSMAMKPKAAAPQAPAPQLQQLEVVRSRTPPNALMYHHTGSSSSNSSGGGYEQIQQQHQHQQPMMAAGPAAIAVVKASDMGGYPINNVMIVKSCSTKYVQQIPNSGVSANGGAYTSGPIDGRIFIEPDRGGGGASTMRRQLGGAAAPGPSLYPPRYTNERYSGPPPPYSTAISSTISSGSQSSIGYGSKYQTEQKPPAPPPPAFYPNPPPPIVQTTPTIAQHYYAPPPPPPPMATMQQQQPSTSFKGGHVPPRSTLQAQYTEKDDGNFVVTENPKKVVEYTENDEGDFMVIEKIIKSPPRIIQIVDEVEPARSTSKGKVCEEEQVEQGEQREDSDYEMEIEEQYQVEDVQKGKVEEEVEQQQQLGTIQIVENEDGTFDDNQQYGLKEMPKPMLISGIGGTPKKCHKFNFIVEPTASSSAGSSATGSPYTPRKKPTSGLKVLSNVKVTTDLSQGIKDIILNLNCKNKGVNVAGSSSSGTPEAAGTSSGVKTSLITGVVNNNCQNELIINNMPPIDLNDVNDIEIINDDEEDLQPGEDEECYIGSMEVKAAEAPTPSVITSVIRMTPHPSPVVAPPSPPPLPPKLETIDPEPEDPPKPSTSEVTITKPTPRKPAPLHHQTPSTSAGSLFHKPPKKLTVKLKTPLPPAPPPTPPLIPTASLKQEAHPVDLEQPSTSAEDCKPNAYFVPVVESAAPETKFRPDEHEPLISSPTTLTLTECSSTEVSRNGPLETIAVTTTTTTKIEQQDALQISETIVYTQSSSPEAAAAAAAEQQASGSPGPPGMVETTTTSVEYYNITIIDDEAAAAAAAAAQCQPSTEVQLPEDGVKPEEEEQDQKVAMYEVKMGEYEPEREPDSPSSGSSGSDEPETKSCIKVEKMEVMEGSGSAPVDESEKKILVAKVEPVSAADTSGEYQKDDHKDFLEAGPSRTVTTADGEGSSSSSSSSSSAVASSSQAVVVSSAGPTFLEYSAEYDDYVPVTSYGMPQEQIPLSWVQKFSPQYTPFDDQNSYMDLDQTDSKTNSNSVGGNSSHATSSGGSGSRIETSMDRAPSAESLNIRTDEKMPAKGEISEQESNGDMELSWNRLYPVHENIPIYPSSYDLSTAQECWNLSNRNSTVTGMNQDHTHQGQHQQQQQYHHHHHLSSSSSSSHHRQQSHQQQQQQHGHQHGISFQFTSHDQPRPEDDDGLVDDKSKIHLDYGSTAAAGASGSGTNTNYLGASSSGASDPHHKLAAKVRTYRCTECPKSFALLKQRRAHMQAEHHEAIVDSKLNVLATAAAASASAASATVTSGAFFANPGEGSSGTTTATMLSKKIKMEPQPVLMSYSSLKQELEQKQEVVGGCDIAGPSTSGMGSGGLGGGGEVRRKRTYVCGTCKHEFDRFKLFNAHLMTHPAECYTCGRSFKHWPNFALHIKRHLGIKDHQCRLCGKKFVIKQKLIEHMRVHTGKAPIKCPDCDQHFRRFSNLAQHRNRHHLNKVPSKKDFVCHCGEVFQSKAKMEWHKEIHENKPKSCPFCREKFIHKNSLTRHIRLSHTEKYVKLETATEMCTICHQPYIKTSMKRHMETHTDERLAYSCTICNKLFSTNWNLKQHKWTHANPTLKPFQCALCSSGFVREADYVTHMNAHKSIRPYTCNHCGCQFIRKYNWIRHTREHETEKNYSCEICNRKFHRKYYLTEHKRIHTGERPFSCNICGKTSSTKTNHNKHIKIHHARDPLTAEG
uniref:C2H2-type domain-containing protein n=1 Tax=Culex tarsalis TaxID=7177 RepID=A0A1Q3EYX0_CULTA